VGPPIWSPDGQTVFLSAMDPSDDEGMSRLDGSWTLYAMNPDTLALRPLATAVIGPVGGTWSPNSQWFAASADLDGQGSQIQLIHVPSGRIFTLRLPMKVTLPIWSLDGRTLVTTPARIRPPEGGLSVPGTELHVIELPDLAALVQDVAPTGK
jgi:hypothetical protein